MNIGEQMFIVSAHSIPIYYPMDPNHFKELDCILQNTCVNYKQIRTL